MTEEPTPESNANTSADTRHAGRRASGGAAAALGSNSLMAIGSAAVIGVYAAGFFKTKAAADRFAADSNVRRPPPPTERGATADRTVERVTPPSADPRATRLRAGATAALPPMPVLERATATTDSKQTAKSAANEPAVIQATVANAVPSVTASADSAVAAPAVVPVAAPVVAPAVAPVAAPVTAPASPPSAPAPAPVQSAAAQPAPVTAKHQEPEPPAPPKAQWKDGTYYGWGTSRHGDIQAAVVIQSGRITNALIAQCLTRYSCSWIAALPSQVVGRQSAEVDYVSGATQSVNAFYYAILEALNHAK